VVEDDPVVADLICDFLEEEKYACEKVHDGHEALAMLKVYTFDLVILDWELPDTSGPQICKEFRSKGGHTPILFLTGKAAAEDKATGLDAGADDYLTKPFHRVELAARIRALIRRQSAIPTETILIGTVSLERAAHKVFKGTEEIALLPREFAVLEYLMVNKDRVLSAESILDHVWESTSDATPDAVRTVVTRLRKKLDSAGETSLITTVYGVGYKVSSTPEK
jgi:DNA-binding response OmpR family regulator